MHDHDIEIIMALTDGTLDTVAADAARANISACAECSLDLELQIAALEALRAVPDAGLTEIESARLRRNVREELGIAGEAAFERSRPRRRMPLAALATAAAVLVAVVVAAPALNLIGGADSDSDDTTIVAEGVAESTTAATFQADGAGNVQDLRSGGVPEAAVSATTAPPAPTTAGALSTTLPPESPTLYAYFRDSTDLEALLVTAAETGFDADESRSLVLKASSDSIVEEQLGDAAACASITIDSSANFVAGFQIARGRLDDRDVFYIVYMAEDPQESELIAHATDNCEELGRAGL